MEKPVHVERYGMKVWETPTMDVLRKEHCMCHNCGNMNPGMANHCEAASEFFKICQKYGNAFILTRCGLWVEKK